MKHQCPHMTVRSAKEPRAPLYDICPTMNSRKFSKPGLEEQVYTAQPENTYSDGFHSPPLEIIRPRGLTIYERPFRDRVFAQQIQKAYENRCAITGIRIINGGGRAEAQAAHIKPVEANGPDHVQNGIALSGTVHWMFDRGLISLGDDLKILKAKGHVRPN